MKMIFFGDLAIRGVDCPDISQELLSFIQGADVVCANLEGPIFHGVYSPLKAGPLLHSDGELATLVSRLGINLFDLANNHILDYGLENARDTISHLGVPGVGMVATPLSSLVRNFIDEHGQSISVIAAAESFFSTIQQTEEISEGSIMSLTDPRFEDLVRDQVRQSDYVIILAHAGLENLRYPLPEWRSVYKRFVDLGASLVVGHHPHVSQPFEIYREGYIFYSTGNLCFSSDQLTQLANSCEGLGVSFETKPRLQMVIDVKQTVYDQVTNLISVVSANEGTPLEIGVHISNLEIDNQVNAAVRKAFVEEFRFFINDAVNGIGLEPDWSTVFRTLLIPGQKKYLDAHPEAITARQINLAHIFRIESYRWAIERALIGDVNVLS
jgi:hypothetical protein